MGKPKAGGEQGRNPEAQEQPQSLHHKTVPATRHRAQKQHWAGLNCSLLGRDQHCEPAQSRASTQELGTASRSCSASSLASHSSSGQGWTPTSLPFPLPNLSFLAAHTKPLSLALGAASRTKPLQLQNSENPGASRAGSNCQPCPGPPAIPPEPIPSALSHCSIPLDQTLSAVTFLWWHCHH